MSIVCCACRSDTGCCLFVCDMEFSECCCSSGRSCSVFVCRVGVVVCECISGGGEVGNGDIEVVEERVGVDIVFLSCVYLR